MSEIKLESALFSIQNFQIQSEMTLGHGLDMIGRSFQIFGEINEKMLKRVDACLTLLENDGRKNITIKLSSTGGGTYDAMAIVGRIKTSNCKITVHAFGVVASAATLILACGNKRKCSSLTQFMWHESQYAVAGRHSQNKETVKQQEREERLWARTMARFCTASDEYWHEVGMSAEKYWAQVGVHVDEYFDVYDLIKMGVIDEIVEMK